LRKRTKFTIISSGRISEKDNTKEILAIAAVAEKGLNKIFSELVKEL